MNIGRLDTAIRADAVGTILLLAWLLFGARRRIGLPAALFAPAALCLSGFVIGNTPITALAPAGTRCMRRPLFAKTFLSDDLAGRP